MFDKEMNVPSGKQPLRVPLSSLAKRRLTFALILLFGLGTVVGLALLGLRSGVAFFRTPSTALEEPPNRFFRLGGMVEGGSLKRNDSGEIVFWVTDGLKRLQVTFKGSLPALFQEGSGVVAEGRIKGSGFRADRIFAKHDETYMPRELRDCLEAVGYWRTEGETGHRADQVPLTLGSDPKNTESLPGNPVDLRRGGPC